MKDLEPLGTAGLQNRTTVQLAVAALYPEASVWNKDRCNIHHYSLTRDSMPSQQWFSFFLSHSLGDSSLELKAHSLLCYADWSNNSGLYALDCKTNGTAVLDVSNVLFVNMNCKYSTKYNKCAFKSPIIAQSKRPGCIFVSHRSMPIRLMFLLCLCKYCRHV